MSNDQCLKNVASVSYSKFRIASRAVVSHGEMGNRKTSLRSASILVNEHQCTPESGLKHLIPRKNLRADFDGPQGAVAESFEGDLHQVFLRADNGIDRRRANPAIEVFDIGSRVIVVVGK